MGWRSAVKEMELYKATLAEYQERAASRSKDRTSSSGRKRKLKKDEDDEEDSSMMEDDEEEEEDAQCEARHVIRASSTTDAGQVCYQNDDGGAELPSSTFFTYKYGFFGGKIRLYVLLCQNTFIENSEYGCVNVVSSWL